MEYPNNIHFQNPKDSEEAVSSPDQLPESTFEFFFSNTTSSDNDNITMCSADDIIISGKLVPSFKGISDLQYSSSSSFHHNPNKTVADDDDEMKQRAFRRRSQSSSELEMNSEKRSKTKLVRKNRSLDYRKPHPSSNTSMVSTESETELLRNLSLTSVEKSEVQLKKATKQIRRSFLMFGLVKVPVEMELSDIKYRQLQRTPSGIFPQANQRSVKGSWKLLNALICRDHGSVAVTPSVCAPQACATSTLAIVSGQTTNC
ncbi:hypothetical protein FEM48_Zijuj01G0009100 [Ziziphus jujuba var. spinosa]|uniref:Uncharacterized protein n=1 Tax=Ziziphus jujuba var. spinosa TaxID=714518 RepID=A0A978VY73_ZIZJJ|nr:uncharacterized protein LOC125418388 [Ziziphus jujuba var. spinosa]KAH7544657.1 hypothetical protein FEM48_Zijuj01G0009100 [Ziziphus jujuba var. spinosa]